MTTLAVDLADIEQARVAIAGAVRMTPVVDSRALSKLTSVPVHLKLEQQQITGSFKLRGATNAVSKLNEAQRRRGVVGVSTGNHGRGLAYAAHQAGVPCIICMSNLVPQNKIDGIKSHGAEVRIVGSSQDDAQLEVDRLVADIYDAALRYDKDICAGGDHPAIVPLLPSSEGASAPHLTWNDEPMKKGEGTFFEIAGVYRRYHCPLSRSIFLGKPPQTFLDAEKTVLEGMEAGLEAAKSGNLCEDIANAFFAVLRKHGIEKDNRTGYPIGLSYPPDWGERTMSLRAGDKSILHENMTFHFMTGLWMQDWGFEITESIVIGKFGPECLANVPRKLIIKN